MNETKSRRTLLRSKQPITSGQNKSHKAITKHTKAWRSMNKTLSTFTLPTKHTLPTRTRPPLHPAPSLSPRHPAQLQIPVPSTYPHRHVTHARPATVASTALRSSVPVAGGQTRSQSGPTLPAALESGQTPALGPPAGHRRPAPHWGRLDDSRLSPQLLQVTSLPAHRRRRQVIRLTRVRLDRTAGAAPGNTSAGAPARQTRPRTKPDRAARYRGAAPSG